MFGAPGQDAGSIFTTGPTRHELPIRARVGNGADEVTVEPLVEHGIVADARARDLGLIGRSRQSFPRL